MYFCKFKTPEWNFILVLEFCFRYKCTPIGSTVLFIVCTEQVVKKIKQKVYSTIKYNNGFGLYVFVWEFSAMRFGKTPFVSQNLWSFVCFDKKSWFFYGNHEDLLSCNELVLGQFGGAMRFHCVCLTSTVIFLLLHVILFNAKSVNGNQFGRWFDFLYN